jgi:hypothetical protein
MGAVGSIQRMREIEGSLPRRNSVFAQEGKLKSGRYLIILIDDGFAVVIGMNVHNLEVL